MTSTKYIGMDVHKESISVRSPRLARSGRRCCWAFGASTWCSRSKQILLIPRGCEAIAMLGVVAVGAIRAILFAAVLAILRFVRLIPRPKAEILGKV
jgi:hypothetical protein